MSKTTQKDKKSLKSTKNYEKIVYKAVDKIKNIGHSVNGKVFEALLQEK